MQLVIVVFLALYFLCCCSYYFTTAITSRRARCAIECYSRCAASGTPKAVYCNCPLGSVELGPCDSANELLSKERTLEQQLPHFESRYKNARTVGIKTQALPSGFIYIFEYSLLSSTTSSPTSLPAEPPTAPVAITTDSDTPTWVFAGASSSPQITFQLPDPCRDYQFRLIVVLRALDPHHQLVIYRPLAIPVELPPFHVPPDSIRLDAPRESSDGSTLHVALSWQNPSGYYDADIFAYEQPTSYPVRCAVPEEHLGQPHIELVEGGAKMHFTLPAEVLHERCRLYAEVHVVPKCVRVASYDLQATMELDCDKFPQLAYCSKRDSAPQCTSVIDVWGGEDGSVSLAWQRPLPSQRQLLATPLYYVVNFGRVHQLHHQSLPGGGGSTHHLPPLPPPLAASLGAKHQRRIGPPAMEFRVPGNQTRLQLTSGMVAPAAATRRQLFGWLRERNPQQQQEEEEERIEPGVEYGLQVCAVYSVARAQPPFHLVSVVSFACARCNEGGDGGGGGGASGGNEEGNEEALANNGKVSGGRSSAGGNNRCLMCAKIDDMEQQASRQRARAHSAQIVELKPPVGLRLPSSSLSACEGCDPLPFSLMSSTDLHDFSSSSSPSSTQQQQLTKFPPKRYIALHPTSLALGVEQNAAMPNRALEMATSLTSDNTTLGTLASMDTALPGATTATTSTSDISSVLPAHSRRNSAKFWELDPPLPSGGGREGENRDSEKKLEKSIASTPAPHSSTSASTTSSPRSDAADKAVFGAGGRRPLVQKSIAEIAINKEHHRNNNSNGNGNSSIQKQQHQMQQLLAAGVFCFAIDDMRGAHSVGVAPNTNGNVSEKKGRIGGDRREAAAVIRLWSKQLAAFIRAPAARKYDKLHLELSELEKEESASATQPKMGTTTTPPSASSTSRVIHSNSGVGGKAKSRRYHATIELWPPLPPRSNKEAKQLQESEQQASAAELGLFDAIPYNFSLGHDQHEKKYPNGVRYEVSICALNSSQLPAHVIVELAAMEQRGEGEGTFGLGGDFASTLQESSRPSAVEMVDGYVGHDFSMPHLPLDERNYTYEEHRYQESLIRHLLHPSPNSLLILVGPVLFLAGMLLFAGLVLCVTCVRLCRQRQQRISRCRAGWGGGGALRYPVHFSAAPAHHATTTTSGGYHHPPHYFGDSLTRGYHGGANSVLSGGCGGGVMSVEAMTTGGHIDYDAYGQSRRLGGGVVGGNGGSQPPAMPFNDDSMVAGTGVGMVTTATTTTYYSNSGNNSSCSSSAAGGGGVGGAMSGGGRLMEQNGAPKTYHYC